MPDFTQGIDLKKLLVGGGTILLENENLAIIDNFLSRGALSIEATPPGGAANDDMYVVDRAPTAATEFEGHGNEIAVRLNGAWYFISPAQGTRLYVQDHKASFSFDGTEWSGGWRANPLIWGSKTSGDQSSTASFVDIDFNAWKISDDLVILRVSGPTTHEIRPLFDGLARCWFSAEFVCTSAGTLEVGIGFNADPAAIGLRRIVAVLNQRFNVYVERLEVSSGQNDDFRIRMRHTSGGFDLKDDTAIVGCELIGPT